jgi:hypothetical protein
MVVSSVIKRRVMKFLLPLPFLVPALGPACAASAAQAPTAQEYRSLIMGIDAGTRSQAAARQWARDASVKRARSRLAELEKVGLDYVLVPTPPAGFVRILGLKRTGGNKGKPPGSWIETETGFTLKDRRTHSRPDAGSFDRADLLDIRIGTERREYREGEKVRLSLQGNRDFYARIVRVDALGRVVQLLPNNYRQISVFRKDKRYLLPDEGDRYALTVRPPFGVLRFVVYATRLPMSHVNFKTIGDGIYEYRSSLKAFARSVRHVIPPGEETLTEFYETSWEIRTLPR